ncbi:MAG: class I tRNA ligase family protein, partial [Desulfurococcales archaeon]|nr:class I tRNA ligase family protein [Desulfurococcales archaeon]
PWIDKVKIVTEDCKEWGREPFVVDVWIDSGIAWLASVKGLKNKEFLNKLFPYNFITEGIDQTRGWFYSLLVTSVLLTGKAPYKEILMQGLVLDKYGRKMTKHLGNVVWGKDAIEKYSVDQLRLYILSGYPPGEPFIFNLEELKEPLSKLNIVWNVFKFADTYMELDGFSPSKHRLEELLKRAGKEDLWILSRVNTVQKRVETHMKNYDLHLSTREVIQYFVKDLSHNYLRLVRPRVWKEEGMDKYVVYAVLYYALKKGLQMLAPITPHFAEGLWQKFIKKYEPEEVESIHLSKLGEIDEEYINEGLESTFATVFEAASFIASLRNEAGIKLRWPIGEAYITSDSEEVIKEIKEGADQLKFLVNAKKLIISGELPTSTEGFICKETEKFKGCVPSRLDEETLSEALVREVIRRIQVMRNKADLNVDEFINVYINTGDEELLTAINKLIKYLMTEVRARDLIIGDIPEGIFTMEWDVEGRKVKIGITRVR